MASYPPSQNPNASTFNSADYVADNAGNLTYDMAVKEFLTFLTTQSASITFPESINVGGQVECNSVLAQGLNPEITIKPTGVASTDAPILSYQPAVSGGVLNGLLCSEYIYSPAMTGNIIGSTNPNVLITKSYADATYTAGTGTYATLTGNNVYTGSNSFNSTTTNTSFGLAPITKDTYTSPTSSTLISKGYADGIYSSLAAGTSAATQDFLGYNSFANKTYINETDGKYIFISSTGLTSADEGSYLPYTRLAVFGDTAYEDGNYASFIVGNEQSPNKRLFIYVDTSYNVGVIGSNNPGKSTLPTCIVNGLGVSSSGGQYVFTPSSSYALDVYGAIHTSTNIVVDGTSTLTGLATAPTPTTGDNSTNIATTAFVQSAITGSGFSTSTTYVLPAGTTLSTLYLRLTGTGTITQSLTSAIKATLTITSQTSSTYTTTYIDTIDFTSAVYINSSSGEYGIFTKNYDVGTSGIAITSASSSSISWSPSTNIITIAISFDSYVNNSYATSLMVSNVSVSGGTGLTFNTISLSNS